MATDEPLAILRDDPHLIAVVKPAGMLTQGYAGGEATLEDAVRRHLRPDDPGSVYLGTVHRLDRPVTGVVVWAKTPKAAARLVGAVRGPRGREDLLGRRRGRRASRPRSGGTTGSGRSTPRAWRGSSRRGRPGRVGR